MNNDGDIFQCRMYENKYPEVDDLVVVNVKQIAEMGAHVSLLEYNNIEGMILSSELSKKRIRSIQKLIRVGRQEIVVVVRVDKEKGYIDLSKKRVSPEDIAKCEERFARSKSVHSILRNVAEKKGVPLETLYEQIGWPLYKKYGHCYNAFKMCVTDADKVLESLEMSPEVKNELLINIVRRMTPQKIKYRSDFEVRCAGYDGINTIKTALLEGEKVGTEEIPIKIHLIAPPLFYMSVSSMDKVGTVSLMEKALGVIESSLMQNQGHLVVKMKPRAVSEVDDRELAIMMEQAERENAEVSGDEDESDFEE